MNSAVLYRWRIKPGREDEFAEAWDEGTRLIHERCGSYGAILHQGEDGLFWSYASWPDEATRQRCFADNDWFSMPCFKVMQDCIAERFEESRLSVLRDQLAERA
ncbi:MAG: antibiotic biosynthesis monooxygenase [Alphaproteobacteria bacterium]|nr:antibiotic biosynthesis monooxygenase [Alphaproteobacteria bacterium]